jgi:hypothetical protein
MRVSYSRPELTIKAYVYISPFSWHSPSLLLQNSLRPNPHLFSRHRKYKSLVANPTSKFGHCLQIAMSQKSDRDSRLQARPYPHSLFLTVQLILTLKMPKVDQAALNLGSQATTNDTRSYSNMTPSRGQAQEQSRDDGRSSISTHSYRSDMDASRLLQQIQGRVRLSLNLISSSIIVCTLTINRFGYSQVFNTMNETYFLPSGKFI